LGSIFSNDDKNLSYQGNDAGGKWRAFCLVFPLILAARPPRPSHQKIRSNESDRTLSNVRSDSFDRISEFKHSHENVWQFFGAKVLSVDRGSGAPFTPCRHSLAPPIEKGESTTKSWKKRILYTPQLMNFECEIRPPWVESSLIVQVSLL